ncbi:MAG: PQQ-binding-like beta-propeller repeat protein [Alphaproteobacteria bacterium]|nr:PQQ-binding-like beta-propeller repeat protein [Alphaproteobacteria bacterium]
MRHRSLRLSVVCPVLAAVSLGACTFGQAKDPPLRGERLAVMVQGSNLRVDNEAATREIAIAPPVANAAWPQLAGSATHAVYHVSLAPAPRQAFRVSAGRGSTDYRRLLAQPVIDEAGRLFVLDALARIYVFDAASGRRLWARDLRPREEQDGTLGGGLAAFGGRVYVTTGFAQVLALDAGDGRVLWRRQVSAPVRSAPTVADGRVFAVSTDNRTHALEAETGNPLWTHRGAVEQAALLGSASPAYESGTLVVAYSSGELFGLRADNGRESWSDFLSQRRRTSGISTIADIRASPVIDRGRVIAVSNAGVMVALSLASGTRVWQQAIGATETPWVAGDFIYLVSNDNVLLCVSRRDGRIVWGRSLRRYEDEKARRDWITWSGPVLAGDRLILAGTNKTVLAVSPYTGDLLGQIKVDDGVEVAPIVARDTLYLLTRDSDLIAWR